MKPRMYGADQDAVADTGDPYQNLANAIVLLAADDYRYAVRYIRRHPAPPSIPDGYRGKRAQQRWCEQYRMIYDCRMFFMGDWIKMLTKLDGAELLRQLEEECNGT